MNTIYKPRVVSSYQTMMSRALDIHSKKHPVQQEIEKSVGTINFTATITEDQATLDLLKHISGVCAFLCTLKVDDLIVAEGRGASVINAKNKYISRNILFAKNASLIDAVVRSTKYLEVLSLNTNSQLNSGIKVDESYQVKNHENPDSITDKQKNYLLELIKSNVPDDERNQWKNQIEGFSRNEASEKIKYFVNKKN